MTANLLATRLIRDVPDFPQPGIIFKDITPVLGSPEAFQEIIDRFDEICQTVQPEAIVGVESRGFIFAAPLALALSAPFVPIRKIGKLPHESIRQEYSLEYGVATIEMHVDAIRAGQRVLIVDDLLATGGTARAAAHLVERAGGVVAGFLFVIELGFLPGRALLSGYDIYSLVKY